MLRAQKRVVTRCARAAPAAGGGPGPGACALSRLAPLHSGQLIRWPGCSPACLLATQARLLPPGTGPGHLDPRARRHLAQAQGGPARTDGQSPNSDARCNAKPIFQKHSQGGAPAARAAPLPACCAAPLVWICARGAVLLQVAPSPAPRTASLFSSLRCRRRWPGAALVRAPPIAVPTIVSSNGTGPLSRAMLCTSSASRAAAGAPLAPKAARQTA